MLDRQDDVQQCPVTDIMAYNHSLARREEDVHEVNDLMLCFRLVDTSGRGKFYVRAIAGKDVFQVEFNPAQTHLVQAVTAAELFRKIIVFRAR